MGDVTPFRRPINWSKLRTDEAETIIRERSQNSVQVVFTDHTWERVPEREIPRVTVFEILRTGSCFDQPERNEKGNWQVILSKRVAGHREAGAVTIILEDEDLLVIRTVEWID